VTVPVSLYFDSCTTPHPARASVIIALFSPISISFLIASTMGNVFRRLMSMLSSKKLEVVLVGLENSGKTTLLQVWSSKVNVSVVISIDVRF
jgi:hypothetical protein